MRRAIALLRLQCARLQSVSAAHLHTYLHTYLHSYYLHTYLHAHLLALLALAREASGANGC